MRALAALVCAAAIGCGGPTGLDGEPGEEGPRGATGETGPMGAAGTPGAPGPTGTTGRADRDDPPPVITRDADRADQRAAASAQRRNASTVRCAVSSASAAWAQRGTERPAQVRSW